MPSSACLFCGAATMREPLLPPLITGTLEPELRFYLGYAELTREEAVIARSTCRPIPSICPRPFQHLEKRYFDVGNEGFKVWRAFDAVVGMCICNDRRWPETFRVMGLQGVEVIALGYNTPTENIHHPEPMHLRMFHHLLTMQANAYPNGTWVLAAAKAGKEDGFGLIGGSAIIAPTGEIGRPRARRGR
jgi:hypothetical protein